MVHRSTEPGGGEDLRSFVEPCVLAAGHRCATSGATSRGACRGRRPNCGAGRPAWARTRVGRCYCSRPPARRPCPTDGRRSARLVATARTGQPPHRRPRRPPARSLNVVPTVRLGARLKVISRSRRAATLLYEPARTTTRQPSCSGAVPSYARVRGELCGGDPSMACKGSHLPRMSVWTGRIGD
jgi:hypothetical protein